MLDVEERFHARGRVTVQLELLRLIVKEALP